MAIPITITCECGRAYDTSQVPREKRAAVVAAQTQFRVYMWFGMLFLAGAAVTGYLVHGMVGLLLAAPCVALFWFRIVQPRVSARQRKALADLPSWTIEAG
jgi:hypothetical protein